MTDPIKAKIQELVPGENYTVMQNTGDMEGDYPETITIAVVLRAILKAKPKSILVDIAGNFWVWEHIDEMPKEIGGNAFWNLEHDNYDQQSEGCKQFIGSLLGV